MDTLGCSRWWFEKCEWVLYNLDCAENKLDSWRTVIRTTVDNISLKDIVKKDDLLVINWLWVTVSHSYSLI